MGLDMYLEAERYLGDYREEDKEINVKVRALFPEMFGSSNLGFVKVRFEAGYWRKVNHIHKWFVGNCQGGRDECQTSYVSREHLELLRNLCKSVMDNRDKAESNLPTQPGFFFGGTDYDEYYYKDTEETIEIIDKCLKLPDSWEFYYHASW